MGKEIDSETIEQVYPLFQLWLKNIKGYRTADGVSQIKLWYEFLSENKETTLEKPIDKS